MSKRGVKNGKVNTMWQCHLPLAGCVLLHRRLPPSLSPRTSARKPCSLRVTEPNGIANAVTRATRKTLTICLPPAGSPPPYPDHNHPIPSLFLPPLPPLSLTVPLCVHCLLVASVRCDARDAADVESLKTRMMTTEETGKKLFFGVTTAAEGSPRERGL